MSVHHRRVCTWEPARTSWPDIPARVRRASQDQTAKQVRTPESLITVRNHARKKYELYPERYELYINFVRLEAK